MNKKRLLGLKSGGGRAVARIGDMHTCPLSDGLLQKHKGGPIFASADTVLFDGEKVARTGDKAECKGATDTLISGSSSVVIGGRNVARIGDKTAHGGMIVEGSSTIFIGGDTIVSIDAIRDAFQVEERRVGVILKRTTLKENSMVAWLSIKGFFVDKPGLGKLVGITWQAEKRANEAFEMPGDWPHSPTAWTNLGHNDAFRHVWWSARLTQVYGETWTRKFTEAHEAVPGNELQREAQDLYNNQQGRQIALDNPRISRNELSELILQAIENGRLLVVDKDMRLRWSDEVPVGEHYVPPS